MEGILEKLKNEIENCEMILIGIGSEWNDVKSEDYDALEIFLGKKNYFIVTSCENGHIRSSRLNAKRITAPFYDGDEGEHQWNFYNQWLQSTLNHRLLLLELGEGFMSPNLIRWPFENITFVNNKAKLYRINATFPNVPDNIKECSTAVKENSYSFMSKLMEM